MRSVSAQVLACPVYDSAAMAQVVLHSKLLHCSRPNTSDKWRLAWMPQYSADPLPGGLAVSMAQAGAQSG